MFEGKKRENGGGGEGNGGKREWGVGGYENKKRVLFFNLTLKRKR